MDESRYIHGDEGRYIPVPLSLITNERYKGLTNDARILFGMLLHRMNLAYAQGLKDEDGNYYVYYTVEKAMNDILCSRAKASKTLSELEQYDLIERVGRGKANRTYVKRVLPD